MLQNIHQEVVFKASPRTIYEALIDPKQHSDFTGSPAKIDPKVGGAISHHDGRIVGQNIELVPNQRIVQAWHFSDWDPGVFSIVRIELKEQGKETKLILDHIGVPENVHPHIMTGWPSRYWEPLHSYLAKKHA